MPRMWSCSWIVWRLRESVDASAPFVEERLEGLFVTVADGDVGLFEDDAHQLDVVGCGSGGYPNDPGQVDAPWLYEDRPVGKGLAPFM